MKLYHYTTLDALAMILKSKSFRFSRLDSVDDPEEYNFIKEGINPAQYVFVSCWSASSLENIPQWKMYASDGHGVRICMDDSMFSYEKYDGKHNNLFPNDFFRGKDYYILPILSRDEFLYDMEYVTNPASITDEIFIFQQNEPAVDFKKLGKYKNIDWQFQREKRFKFCIVPLNNGRVSNSYLADKITSTVRNIDIPIVENVFHHMEVLLGPNMMDSERIIAESLLRRYVNSPVISNSIFLKR